MGGVSGSPLLARADADDRAAAGVVLGDGTADGARVGDMG